MGTATFVKQKNALGDAAVYRLDPPFVDAGWGGEQEGPYEYVWVSAVVAMYTGPETYIFPCDEDGEVTDWGELKGSYRGGLDHAEALRNAGYEVSA